jgi:hypothetical protein
MEPFQSRLWCADVFAHAGGTSTSPGVSNSAWLMRVMLSYRAGDESIASILRT